MRRLTEEKPIEVRAVNLRMTPRTGALEKCPGCLVMEERGVAMTFQTEHTLFPPLQEKRVGRSVRHMTARASLNTTGQMFKGEWAAFLDMAPSAGLVLYTAEGKTTQAPMGRMTVSALHGTLQDLVVHGQGKSATDLPVAGKAEIRRLLPQEMDGCSREMRRMTIVTGDPGQLMLAPPELKLPHFFLVTSETDLSARLG